MCFEESKKSNLNCNILILIKINGIIYPIQSTTPWSPQCLLLLNPLTPRYLSEPCFAKCNIGDNWFPAYGPRTTFHTHFITRVSQGPERTRLVSFLHTLTQFAYEICTPPSSTECIFLYVPQSVMAFAILLLILIHLVFPITPQDSLKASSYPYQHSKIASCMNHPLTLGI